MNRDVLRRLAADPIRKIFAIVFAFALWFFVAIGGSYRYATRLGIDYRDLPDSLIIVERTEDVGVLLNGTGRALITLRFSRPRIVCDMSEAKVGEMKVPVQELRVPFDPHQVTHGFEERTVAVLVDRKMRKPMKVEVPFRGSLRNGYAVTDVIVVDTVYAVGPRQVLLGVSALESETLDLKGMSESFERTMPIYRLPSATTLSRDLVRVAVQVDTAIQRTFVGIPVRLIYAPSQRVRAARSMLDTLVVEGPRGRLEALTKSGIEIRIRVIGLAPGEYDLPAEITLPEYIRPVASAPQRFAISVD